MNRSDGPTHATPAPGSNACAVAHRDEWYFRNGVVKPEWVRSGDPRWRNARLVQTSDESAAANLWECTAGTFQWYYVWHEIIYILDGECRVTDADGVVTTLKAGDTAHFPAGSTFKWEIDHFVRKVAVNSRPSRTLRQRLTKHRMRIAAVASVLFLTIAALVLI